MPLQPASHSVLTSGFVRWVSNFQSNTFEKLEKLGFICIRVLSCLYEAALLSPVSLSVVTRLQTHQKN